MHAHLHVGAHKTATTYLQIKCEQNAHVLRGAGVEYRPHRVLRPLLRSRRGSSTDEARTAARGRLLEKLIGKVGDCPRLLYCEELLLGTVRGCLDKSSLYPAEDMLIAELSRLILPTSCSISISIRSYDTFLPAFYVLALRKSWTGSFQRYCESINVVSRGWAEVVADVLASSPRGRITVWRYEDFPRLEAACLEVMAGRDLQGLTSPALQNITPSASAVRLGMIAGRFGGGARGLELGEKLFGSSRSTFAPFTPERRHALQELYRRDCERIASMPGVKMIG